MTLNPRWDVRNRAHKLIDYHGGKFQRFAIHHGAFWGFGLNQISHYVAPASRRRFFGPYTIQKRRRDAGATKSSMRFNFFPAAAASARVELRG